MQRNIPYVQKPTWSHKHIQGTKNPRGGHDHNGYSMWVCLILPTPFKCFSPYHEGNMWLSFQRKTKTSNVLSIRHASCS